MVFKMQDDLLPGGGKNEDAMISRVFLTCLDLNSDLPDRWTEFKKASPDGDMDVNMSLLIDGKEVDVAKFFNHLWSQYSRQVEMEATRQVREKLTDTVDVIVDKLNDTREIINGWCDDITWETPNPFKIHHD